MKHPLFQRMRTVGHPHTLLAAMFLLIVALGQTAPAQFGAPGTGPKPGPMKKASDLIHRQEGPKINKDLEGAVNPDNSHVIISLSKQRVYLMTGDQIYIDSPVSTGKRAGMTPTGDFSVLEKDPNHHSSVYGNFVDGHGRTVRSGISTRVDSAPSGTHYVGAPMKWFCRLTNGGVGMHIGILPGYPASHGCVRLPAEIAPIIYQKVRVGTKVEIEP
jgi:lipoprotein-anchoring transpeptidase ErfK/SrfK